MKKPMKRSRNEVLKIRYQDYRNDLQKEIIRSILLNTESINDFVEAIKNTFPINTLCEMLGINRNRYYYLKSNGKLDSMIMDLILCL